MTRAEAKAKLVSYGVAEPTEEQITDLLNSINAETKKEKERADGYKAKADKADELQAQLDEKNSQDMTEVEKARKDLETANNKIAELERVNAIRDQRSKAMEQFKITSEQANSVIKDDGSMDYEALGKIISDKETASATAKEQEIANKASNPGGGSASSGAEDKSNAERLASKFFGAQKQNNDILSHYVGGN